MLVRLAIALLASSSWAQDSLFHVRFESPEIPVSPDHGERSPGPSARGADRAGYTAGDLHSSFGIVWNDAGVADGKTALYVQSVSVDFAMPIAIGVSSEYKRGSCPYDKTWRHELGHARAMKELFASAQEDFAAALEDSQSREPRLPTKDAPLRIKPEEIESFRAAVDRKLRKVLRERSRAMLAAMEKDRRRKDSEEEYSKTYDECTSIEWEYRL